MLFFFWSSILDTTAASDTGWVVEQQAQSWLVKTPTPCTEAPGPESQPLTPASCQGRPWAAPVTARVAGTPGLSSSWLQPWASPRYPEPLGSTAVDSSTCTHIHSLSAYQTHIFFKIFKMILKALQRARGGETEIFSHWFTPRCLQQPELGQAKAKSWGTKLGSPTWMAGA